MLGVGIDWAERFHLVALGRPGEGVFDVARVEHDPGSLDALVARIALLEPAPPRCGWYWRPATGCWWSSSSTQASRWCR